MTTRPIGLKELARIAAVSVATASRALADNPRVAIATREKIQRLARENGFRLNQTASAFRKQRTATIRVIVPLGHGAGIRLTDPFFVAMIGPLADALTRAGYDLLLTRVVPDHPRWLDDLVNCGRADGVIVIGQSVEFRAIERVAEYYRPLVVWGARLPGAAEISVGSDNEAGGRLAAAHLIERRRKRLAFVGDTAMPEFAARYAGFQAVVAASAGIDEASPPITDAGDRAHADIMAVLAGATPPDGIFAASDMIAMGCLRAIDAAGRRVPRDISLIGYDDVSVARNTVPPLTTIRQDMETGAEILVELLLGRINGDDVVSVVMAPELVIRGST